METAEVNEVCAEFVRYMETGERPEAVFTQDVFLDFTLPLWRIQAKGLAEVHAVRMRGHPDQGRVPHWSATPTARGFVMEAEERWTNSKSEWYCREVFVAEINDGKISRLSVYCTGDWDLERQKLHRSQVVLMEP